MKRELTEWGEIFVNDMTNRRLIFNIINSSYNSTSNNNKKKTSVKKWAEESNKHFFQIIYADDT